MFIEKIWLGIALAAPIGPVSLEMIKRGLNSGFLSALVVRLGGILGNTLCLLASFFGMTLLSHSSNQTMALYSFLGSLVLIYLGIKTFLDKKHYSFQTESAPTYNIFNGLMTGFILSIANPIGIVFWLTIFAATLDYSQMQSSLALFQNFSILLGVLLWGVFLSGLLEVGKRFINPKAIKFITMIAGITLIVFGLKYSYKAFLLFS